MKNHSRFFYSFFMLTMAATLFPVSAKAAEPLEIQLYAPSMLLAEAPKEGRKTTCGVLSVRENVWSDAVGNVFYAAAEEEPLAEQWVPFLGGRYYVDAAGHPLRDTIFVQDGDTYVLDATGRALTGVQNVDGKLYYYEETGEKMGRRVNDPVWIETSRGVVLPGADGALLRNRFVKVDGKYYYINPDGYRGSGRVKFGNTTYDLAADGSLVQGEHLYSDGEFTYITDKKGYPYRNKMVTIEEGDTYILNADGQAMTGMVNFGSLVYRVGDDGRLVPKAGVYESEGKRYVSDAKGMPLTDRVVKVEGASYYVGSDGVVRTGLIEGEKGAYYGDPKTGILAENAGRIRTEKGDVYSGKGLLLATGWVNIDGEKRYFDAEGWPVMVTKGARSIGDDTYDFDEKGNAKKRKPTFTLGSEWRYDGLTLAGDAVKTRAVGEDFVIISLSHQFLWIFKDGELALKTGVISGKPETPTVRGNFRIQTMQRDRRLKGPTWDSFVHYWVQFYGSYGIHDAPWQSSGNFYYDSEARYWTGSHGCVNIRSSRMPAVWSLVYEGMPVVVY